MDKKIFLAALQGIEEFTNKASIFSGAAGRVLPAKEKVIPLAPPPSPINQHLIAFIDGGMGILLNAPSFSLSFIRLYASLFNGTKKAKGIKKESLLLIKAKQDGGRHNYEAICFGSNTCTFSFNPCDRDFSNGTAKAPIAAFPGIVRRLLEIDMAKELLQQSDKIGTIVLDGRLSPTFALESSLVSELIANGATSQIGIAALAKTSEEIKQIDGQPGTQEPGRFPWMFPLPADTLNSGKAVQMKKFLVRLHKSSSHIFLLEIADNPQLSAESLAASLLPLSKDPIFLGYPYGLIDADQKARVSNNEVSYLKSLLQGRAGKSFHSLEPQLNALNAHCILDKVSF